MHAELKRGVSGLATIGSTAPFVCLFGTVVGIMAAFLKLAADSADGVLVPTSVDITRPEVAKLSNTRMISSDVAESRLPVGSSASSMDGSFTSARAMATR